MYTIMYRITLNKGKEKQPQKHHPWVFSGAILETKPKFTEADWAEVFTYDGEFIAYGYYDEKSQIMLTLLSWDQKVLPSATWIEKQIKNSIERRRNLLSRYNTTTLRLVHGEADFIPGVYIDKFAEEATVTILSRFTDAYLSNIVKALTDTLDLVQVVAKIHSHFGPKDGLKDTIRYFDSNGNESALPIVDGATRFKENGIWYEIEQGKSDKGTFQCDQRDNRVFISQFFGGKTVLDACSHTGSFTLHALKSNALSVTAVDSSEQALRHLLYQVNINEDYEVIPQRSREKVIIKHSNIFTYMREVKEGQFDIIILDPPKLAPTKSSLENALKAYKDLNRLAMMKVKNEGIIATFSSSAALSKEMFQTMLAWAATDAKVEIQILHHLSAGSDHPIRLSFPESEYLKGAVIRVIRS